MTDEEILKLRSENAQFFEKAKQILYDAYLARDEELKSELKKNAKHHHFKNKKDMQEAMSRNCNIYSTFSFGKKAPEFLSKGSE